MTAQLDIRKICVKMATLRNGEEISNILSGIASKVDFQYNVNESTDDLEIEHTLHLLERMPYVNWGSHLEGRQSDELTQEGYDC